MRIAKTFSTVQKIKLGQCDRNVVGAYWGSTGHHVWNMGCLEYMVHGPKSMVPKNPTLILMCNAHFLLYLVVVLMISYDFSPQTMG